MRRTIERNKEVMAAIHLEGERFDLDERIAAELFKLTTPKPKNVSGKKMEECRKMHEAGKLDIPLPLPDRQDGEDTAGEPAYTGIGEYEKALSNMTLDEVMHRF